MTSKKRALVLGCGGVAGAAWQIATLEALETRLGWDARDADILIGTSAGAVLAALLGAGVSVKQLGACQRGEAGECCTWNHDTDTGGALPPWPKLGFTGAKLLWKGLKGEVSSLSALCGVLPKGGFDMAPFRRLIDSAVPAGEWTPHPATWIVTVEVDSGKRVAFGREGAPAVAMNDAVCASYGVPGWCPPVHLHDRQYIDGGVASPVSADLLLDTDVEEVIVMAPMASRHLDAPTSAMARVERRVRRSMTAIVDREVAQLESAGKRVIRLEPGAEDLVAIGYNMMDPKRRRQVYETACRTSSPAVEAALRE